MKNLTLRQTVLALTTIPLLIQVALLFGFVSLQKDAEKQVALVNQKRAVLTSIDDMQIGILELLASYRKERPGKMAYLELYDDFAKKSKSFDEKLKEVKQLVPDDAESIRHVKEIEALRTRTLRLFRQYVASFSGELQGDDSRTWIGQELNDTLAATVVLLPQISSHLRHLGEEDTEEKARLRNQQAWLMMASAAIDVLLTVGVAVLLVQSVLRRIDTISDNANRLARGEELNPATQGNDELARLDQVFHKMALDLKESARLRDDLIAMVSHDLKAPLMVIGNALSALEETPSPLDPEKYLSIAQRNSKRAWALVSDFLDREKALSGTLSVAKVQTSLAALFADCKETIEPIMGELDVKLEIEPTDLVVDADPESLTRILVNLVVNAAKFSKEGSVVQLGAEKQDDEFARVWVKDQGEGMSPDELEHVFDRFHKGKARGRLDAGSGLGLAICKTLIELHGGKIWVESKEGVGSTFYFTLPLHALVQTRKGPAQPE